RRKRGHAVDVVRMIGRKLQREQRAHRETADENAAALIAQRAQRLLEGRVPVSPPRLLQLLERRAMSRKLRTRDGEARGSELPHQRLHLRRRAGDAVREQHAGVAAFFENVVSAWSHRQEAPQRWKRLSSSSMPRSISSSVISSEGASVNTFL